MAVDVEPTRRRFTLDEYHRMVEVGILNEDDRVELIRGEIVQMAPIGRDHASCVARLTHVLLGRLHGRTVLWPQNPLTILPDSEPQPDIILLPGGMTSTGARCRGHRTSRCSSRSRVARFATTST